MLAADVEEIAEGIVRVFWRLDVGVSAVGGMRDFGSRSEAEEWLVEFREDCAMLQAAPAET
jgi:hypothetical protein